MMSAPELTPTVLSLALALLARSGTTDGAITCEAVTTKYESTVTCFFGTDIFDTKHSFNLQFHYPNLQAEPETHLMCTWVTAEDLNCKEGMGVVYNRVLADQMTVKGPADPGRAGGKYVCQVLPLLGVPVKPCNLTFRDVTTTTTTATTTQSNALEDLREKVTTTLILSHLVLIVALIILIAVLFIVCTRLQLAERIRKWRMQKTKESDAEKMEGKTEETTDNGEKEKPSEKKPLLTAEAKKKESDAEKMEGKREETTDSGEKPPEEKPLPTTEAPTGPSSGEAGSPDASRPEETQPAEKESDRRPEPSGNDDVQVEVTRPEEAHLLPEKKKGWWKNLFSSGPKAEPWNKNPTGTGAPQVVVTTGNEGRSSGKKKKKSSKAKEEAQGEGGKDSPGNEEKGQQRSSPADGGEAPRRQQHDQ